METPATILLLWIPLTPLVISDLRMRQVSVWWLVALGMLSLIFSLNTYGIATTLIHTGSNLLLIIYLTAGILLYLRLKTRRWVNPLKAHIGAGDLVFLCVVAPLYDLRTYLFFLLAALVLSLFWAVGMRAIRRPLHTVPLVSTLGVTLALTTALTTFTPLIAAP